MTKYALLQVDFDYAISYDGKVILRFPNKANARFTLELLRCFENGMVVEQADIIFK